MRDLQSMLVLDVQFNNFGKRYDSLRAKREKAELVNRKRKE